MQRTLTIIACALYVLSPVDLMPEIVLGPFGLPDDLVAGLVGLHALIRRS